jgi:tRNA (guanine-N7-)-methyltransferase
MIKQKKQINSFVKRSGRLTNAQKKILNSKNNNNNFFLGEKNLNFKELFNNNNKCILDIGFGDGKLLVSTAKKFPEINFIGIEVYDSGIGNILKQISEEKLENIKVSNTDAIIFLESYVENNCLHGITLFFPDPWPKKKHFKRRIINEYFLELISEKIIKNGFVTIATDWCNYSEDIVEIFDKNSNFEKINGIYLFKKRCLTKFEKRGISLGHRISELSYILK